MYRLHSRAEWSQLLLRTCSKDSVVISTCLPRPQQPHLHRVQRQLTLVLLDPRHHILNCAHLDPPLLAKLQAVVCSHHTSTNELRPPIHALTVVDHLADHTHGLLARQSAQVNRSLGMPPAHPDASISRLQRQNVSRPPEVAGLGIGVRKHAACEAPVVGADASRDAFIIGIDGDSIGSAIGVRIVGDHLRKVQGGGARNGQRRADVARAVADHEGGLLGCERLGGDDQVPFVLAVGRVKDNYEFAIG
jgi:hypothetical protein